VVVTVDDGGVAVAVADMDGDGDDDKEEDDGIVVATIGETIVRESLTDGAIVNVGVVVVVAGGSNSS